MAWIHNNNTYLNMATDLPNGQRFYTSFTSNRFEFSIRRCLNSRLLLIPVLLFSFTACVPVEQPAPPPPTVEAPPPPPELSSDALKSATRSQILFAQAALTELGYRIGQIDGLWGPRSANAIRQFESQQEINSANGFLSELSLDRLAKSSGLDPATVKPQPVLPKGVTAKLAGKPLSTGPHLVIIERNYDVFSKPNPYSQKILKLQTGTGIYVISEKDGWYKIESINRKQGYIQAD